MTLKSLNFTLLVINVDSEDLSILSDELQKKRMTAPEFFNDAPIVVKVDDHSLNIDFAKLKQTVIDQCFILLGISGDLSDIQKELIKEQKIAILRGSKRDKPKDKKVMVERRAYVPTEVKTKVYTGRVRSGQQIYAKEGDLVIIGDVGAGAEVIADGNIHIYGVLSGKALAGAMGNKETSIFCHVLYSELVSVAGVYKLSDDLPKEFLGKSCIVSLEEEQIVIAKLSKDLN